MLQQIIIAFLLAFGICLIIGPILIPMLKKMKFGQNVRLDGPQKHISKQGTPTIGGLIIMAGILSALLFIKGDWFMTIAMVCTFGFGIIGFLDDFIKVKMKRSLGLRAYQKIIAQLGIAFVIALWAYKSPLVGSEIMIPWLNTTWDLGIFYIPFTMFVVIAVVNAVNLTDGLDGLASGVMMIDSIAFSIIFVIIAIVANASGNVLLGANYNDMAVFSIAVAGACFGFLRFNVYPARVFMGDTGSFALGGALSAMGILSKNMLIIPIIGLMFVASCISVILQVGSYKLRNKKRIFLMAPIHHHFELMGFPETKIVAMYMIVTTVLSLLVLLGYVG